MKPEVKVRCLGANRIIVKVSNLNFLKLGKPDLEKAHERFARYLARAYPQLVAKGREGVYFASRDQEVELYFMLPPPVGPRVVQQAVRDIEASTEIFWQKEAANAQQAASRKSTRRANRSSAA